MKKRTTEIIVERDELLIISRRARALRPWCPDCGREVLMLTPEEAARLTGTSPRAIYRLVEAGLVHFVETPDRCLLVCPSLLG